MDMELKDVLERVKRGDLSVQEAQNLLQTLGYATDTQDAGAPAAKPKEPAAKTAKQAADEDARWTEQHECAAEADARRAEIAEDIRSAALFLSLAGEQVTPMPLPGPHAAAAIAAGGTSPGRSAQ
jgi:hypothetical protein